MRTPSSSPNRPRIAVVLSSGWSVLNLLHSGIAARLSAIGEVVCIVPSADGNAGQVPIEGFRVIPLVGQVEGGVGRLARQAQKSLYFERFEIRTQALKARSLRRKPRGWRRYASSMTRLIGKSPLGHRAILACESLRRLAYPSRSAETLLARESVSVILTANPVDPVEDGIVYAARRLGVPVVSLVASWDNLSSKGVIDSSYNRVLVWNEFMAAELLDTYPQLPTDSVAVVGIPRFDIYREPVAPGFNRQTFLGKLGLNPEKPMLFYGNTATALIPGQPAIIRALCDARDGVRLPADLQILVRTHPRDDARVYAEFVGVRGVSVWVTTENLGNIYAWWPQSDSQATLAAMLKHAAVSVNPCSTLTLDAVACGVPVVNVAYDGDAVVAPQDSIAVAYGYTHMRPVVESRATVIATNEMELISAVRSYLDCPDLHAVERADLAALMCFPRSGRAVDAVVAQVSGCLHRVASRRRQ